MQKSLTSPKKVALGNLEIACSKTQHYQRAAQQATQRSHHPRQGLREGWWAQGQSPATPGEAAPGGVCGEPHQPPNLH